MKPIYVMLFVALFNLNAIAQSVNDYKYVIVPDRYSWTSGVDEYQVNSLTTFLFKKYGFDAYQLGSILPGDMNAGRCNSLTADVEEFSSFVKTKLKVILKDCKGDVVFISQEGTSKDKDYKKAYHESLRNAFMSIKELDYSYEPSQIVEKEDVQENAATESTTTTIAKPVSVKEVAQDAPLNEVVQQKPEIQTYKSLDAAYSIIIRGGIIKFYEGDTEIGTSYKKATDYYKVETTEFEGKGYFLNNQFIVERQIKGIQDLVKMIFEKE